MNEFSFTDQESRLLEMGGWFVAVDARNVNLDDLANCRPGSIVRCKVSPNECISVHYVDEGPVGCVAGWISEE